MLTLQGIPVYVSGMAGHFVDSQNCSLRLHWRIGSLRISTVGACLREGGRTQVTLGTRLSRDAERLHYHVASQIAAAFAHERRELTDDEVGQACRFAELWVASVACDPGE